MVMGFGSSFTVVTVVSWAKRGLIAATVAAVTINFLNIVMLFLVQRKGYGEKSINRE
jgi:hypothetical protein